MSNPVEDLYQAIVEGDDEAAPGFAHDALAAGVPALDILNKAIVPGIEEAGRLWHHNKYFLPDVILSAGAFKAALAAVHSKLGATAGRGRGRIVLGVVAGDMHDLGKIIVTAMLTGGGFEVIDLGVDVPIQTFIDKARELKPDILGLGAYMTTTMLLMKDVVDGLKAAGLRDNVKVMVGGVPTTQEFADEVGADAWGKDALDAVGKARRLMEA